MKICMTATGSNLNAQMDPRFGRCQYFVIVDSDTMEFEAMPNESIGAMGGAEIQAAQTIVNRGVEVIISGNIGPNAFQILSAADVNIVTGTFDTVRDAVEMYKSGRLTETRGATVAAHTGMGSGMGMRGGRGGREQGRMGGRGLGPGGKCRCPNCGYTMAHQAGVPCYQQNSPKCGNRMTRP